MVRGTVKTSATIGANETIGDVRGVSPDSLCVGRLLVLVMPVHLGGWPPS